MQNGLYIGNVYHARHRPFFHDYKYKVFTLCCDIDTLPELSKNLNFFSFNKWNILSFCNKNHGPRNGSELRPWIENAAAKKNINIKGGQIFFVGFPRLWGYVFNPLSVYFCTDNNNKLKAILYQVKNTFGEQHCYLCPVEKSSAGNPKNKIEHDTDKIFHVSPFIHMNCRYHFHLRMPEEKLGIAILQDEKIDESWQKILSATWDGKRRPLNDWEILKAVAMHPLMTFKVMFAIHWQALRLWLKGAKYIRRPALPEKEIS